MKKKTAWLAALAPVLVVALIFGAYQACLLYTSPSPRDA